MTSTLPSSSTFPRKFSLDVEAVVIGRGKERTKTVFLFKCLERNPPSLPRCAIKRYLNISDAYEVCLRVLRQGAGTLVRPTLVRFLEIVDSLRAASYVSALSKECSNTQEDPILQCALELRSIGDRATMIVKLNVLLLNGQNNQDSTYTDSLNKHKTNPKNK
ncbi:hypothetical protein JZ751_000988 [Albula glossodonta]|uniref:Uncharacterized protein n=1 Tax=Albula glossodonta TaxID=121402 RepID=A0A8T2PXV7_9TELE|nr:hypothetical protein JZ751_000988 [Albula glossodonta]